MNKGTEVEKYIKEHRAEFENVASSSELHSFSRQVAEKFGVGIYCEMPDRNPIPGSLQASRRVYQMFWFEIWSLRLGKYHRKLSAFSVCPG